MSKTNTKGKKVAVVIGATSKWQSDGRNTMLAHGKPLDDSVLPVGVRWGIGGAIARAMHGQGATVALAGRNRAVEHGARDHRAAAGDGERPVDRVAEMPACVLAARVRGVRPSPTEQPDAAECLLIVSLLAEKEEEGGGRNVSEVPPDTHLCVGGEGGRAALSAATT